MDTLENYFPDQLKPLLVTLYPLKAISWIFDNTDGLLAIKIVFLLLPLLFFVVANVATLIAAITLIFRSNRNKFIATIMITWWDGGRAIFSYWAGILKFFFMSFGWIFGALRVSILGIVQTIKDVIFLPVTILANMAKGYAQPGIPWIAVLITVFWITLEALIFSFVLTPMVSEILISLTDTEPHHLVVSVGLFIFLFMIIGGSMACMHGLVEALEKRNTFNIIKMSIIELVVMMLEVVFFYREFVESVLPFFNRMSSSDLALGPGAILGIGIVAWLGVRAGTWFFFGRYGTPTLLMIISREGMNASAPSSAGTVVLGGPLSWVKNMTAQIKQDIDWFNAKGYEMTEYFVLPPVQILAVMTNFCMVILTDKNLFNLPVKSIAELRDTKTLINEISE